MLNQQDCWVAFRPIRCKFSIKILPPDFLKGGTERAGRLSGQTWGQHTPPSSSCHLSADLRLSQGSVALEMLFLPLYFWVSDTGGLGVFLPPGVCLRSVSPVWPRLNRKPDKQGAVDSFHIRLHPHSRLKVLIYDIQTVWFNILRCQGWDWLLKIIFIVCL